MCKFLLVSLCAFAAVARGNEPVKIHADVSQDSTAIAVGKLTDELSSRAVKLQLRHDADLERTTLGKSAVSPARASPLLSASRPIGFLPARMPLPLALHPFSAFRGASRPQDRGLPASAQGGYEWYPLDNQLAAPLSDDVNNLLDECRRDPVDALAVLTTTRAVCAKPVDSNWAEMLTGDWKIEWTSLTSSEQFNDHSTTGSIERDTTLRKLSYGALPDVNVTLKARYNRITPTEEGGGIYELFEVFTLPEFGGVEAALVLSGTWDEHHDGAPGRAFLHYDACTVVPSRMDASSSFAMIQFAKVRPWVPKILVDVPETYFDMEYIDDSIRIHKGASGAVYIMSRDLCPFTSP